MEVQPTPDQSAFIREAIASGRLHSPEDAMQEALLLWEERERRRLEILETAELSRASLARGGGRRVTSQEGTAQLARDIALRCGERLDAKRNQP